MNRRMMLTCLTALALVAGTAPAPASTEVSPRNPGNADGTWVKLRTHGTPPSARSRPATAAVGRHLFVFGGVHDSFAPAKNTFFNDLYRLDTKTGRWVEIKSRIAPEPRAWTPAVRHGSSFVVFGGSRYNEDETVVTVFDDLWAFDTVRLRWRQLHPVNAGPSGRSGSTLWEAGDKLYVFGGIDANQRAHNDLWRYDFRRNSWTRLSGNGDPAAPRGRHFAMAPPTVRDGKLTFYGGEGVDDGNFPVLTDAWQFDLATNTWTDITPRAGNLEPPHNYSATGLIGNRLYLHGGDVPGGDAGCGAPHEQNPTADVWSFDLATKQWRQHRPSGAPTPLKRHMAAVISGRMYVTAGYDWHCANGTGPGQIWNLDTYVLTP